MDLALNNLKILIFYKTQKKKQRTVFLCKTEVNELVPQTHTVIHYEITSWWY